MKEMMYMRVWKAFLDVVIDNWLCVCNFDVGRGKSYLGEELEIVIG